MDKTKEYHTSFQAPQATSQGFCPAGCTKLPLIYQVYPTYLPTAVALTSFIGIATLLHCCLRRYLEPQLRRLGWWSGPLYMLLSYILAGIYVLAFQLVSPGVQHNLALLAAYFLCDYLAIDLLRGGGGKDVSSTLAREDSQIPPAKGAEGPKEASSTDQSHTRS